MKYDEMQLKAIQNCIDKKISIITGGAGYGKTTIIKAVLDILEENRPKDIPKLMAPTGKAACRMTEATGRPAMTIHKYLSFNGEEFFAEIKKHIIIIDEASMCDAQLLGKLIQTQPEKLILVGDSSQLAPVGAGSPFHTLIDYHPEISVTLKHCYRASEAIHQASMMIRHGKIPQVHMRSEFEEYKFVNAKAFEMVDLIAKRIEESKWDPVLDLILVSQYKGDIGIDVINEYMVNKFNPQPSRKKDQLLTGDRVINTKNLNKLEFYNGEMGMILRTNKEGVSVKLDKGHIVTVPAEDRKRLKLGYAISVHKSQGSQCRHLIFIAAKAHSNMLTRSLIYTAVSRAKKSVLVLGNKDSYRLGITRVKAMDTVLRYLYLKQAENEI